MALSWYSASLARSECLGLEAKQYANAQVANGFTTAKLVKIKALQIQTKNVKIRSQQMEAVNLQPCLIRSQRMEAVNLQPCLVRREALVGLGTSFLTIIVSPTKSAEARTVKPDLRKKIMEKLDELREKAGLKKKNEREKSSTDSETTPKASSELAPKGNGLLVEADV